MGMPCVCHFYLPSLEYAEANKIKLEKITVLIVLNKKQITHTMLISCQNYFFTNILFKSIYTKLKLFFFYFNYFFFIFTSLLINLT